VRSHRAVIGLLCLGLAIHAAQAAGQSISASSSGRVLTVADVLNIQSLGEVQLSPDGARLAVVIAPGARGKKRKPNWFLGDSVLWLIALRDGKRWVVMDSTGALLKPRSVWQPRWSPSGRYLAFLYTYSFSEGVFVGIWSAASRRLIRNSRLPVDLGSTLARAHGEQGNIVWLGDSVLAYVTFPGKRRPIAPDLESLTQRLAPPQWAMAERGLAPTSSAIESPADTSADPRSIAQLVMLDLRHDLKASLQDLGPVWNSVNVQFSPNVRTFAILVARSPRVPDERARMDKTFWVGRTVAGIGRTGVRNSISWLAVASLQASAPLELTPGNSCWTPDSRSFVFLAKSSEPGVDRAIIADTSGGVAALAMDSVRSVSQVICANSREAWVRVRAGLSGDGDEWLRVSLDGRSTERLTAGVDTVPSDLRMVDGAGWAIGIVGQDLVAIPDDARERRSLTVKLRSDTTSSTIEGLFARRQNSGLTAFVRTGGPTHASLQRLELSSDSARSQELALPAAGAALMAAHPPTGVLVYRAGDPLRGGPIVWLSTPAGARELFHLNDDLRRVTPPRRQLIRYVAGGNDTLTALVALPVTPAPPSGYPAVVWVYPGEIHADTNAVEFSRARNGFADLELLTAHGYAVLLPSLPMPLGGTPSEPYAEISEGVMPAVDRAIALGLVDSTRLGLMGLSYGGYAAYVMATATARFRAIVSLAGPANLVSLYGQFDPRLRYSDEVQQNGLEAVLAEDGQILMGDTPYHDASRYWRNSPLAHVEDVHTPVLIIQGDLDYVPLTQGEEFFSALYRLGRRARFVRYFGEGHEILSPPNVKDAWREIFSWLDLYVAGHSPH
jgi:dipeptidyl aminopeptidase/acylaminoacyl peptidase